mgnify:FL=1
MYYVIQTTGGQESEVCLWINTFVDKGLFDRCFVPLYEDVWRKGGIGHISVKKMFPGYIFLETDKPEAVYMALKELPKMSQLLYMPEDDEAKSFEALYPEEEEFFREILSEGMMRVSYVKVDKRRKISTVIGPLAKYQQAITKVDVPHRYAIVEMQMLGRSRTVKFGLWMDIDPKIPWIEEAKSRLKEDQGTIMPMQQEDLRPDNIWDWKSWREINEARKIKIDDEQLCGYKAGDMVVNTTGVYGDMPFEVVKVNPKKNTLTVGMMLFGNATKVEMSMDDVRPAEGE